MVFIIAIPVVGVIWLAQGEQEKILQQKEDILLNTKAVETEYFEPSQQIVRELISRILPAQFDVKNAEYTISDLNGDNTPELIITATEQLDDTSSRPSATLIQIVSVLNREGKYTSLGKIQYQERIRGVPVVKELRDIDGDNQKELIVSLMYGGVSSAAEGILDVDFSNKKLSWVQLRDEEGRQQDAIFFLASAVAHYNYFEIQDIDKDGNQEIIEVFAQVLPGTSNPECDAIVYEWNGNLFSYNRNLSKTVLSQLGSNCELQNS